MQNTTEQIDKMTESLMRACSDINAMMRDSMNAALQSATVLTKGYEEIYDSISVLVQKSLESNAQATRSLMNARTAHDLMDTQSMLMKNGFDSLMAEINKITQLSSRIAQQASEPVTQNMNATIVKLSRNRAA